MRVRVKHIKIEEAVFISHLDLVTTMNRALRRAEIPFRLTEGFNPRPRIAYGQPLALGAASAAEYFDVFLQERLDPGQIKNMLNSALPRSLEVSEAREVPVKSPSLMSLVKAADYLLQAQVREGENLNVDLMVESMLKSESLNMENKKGQKKDLKKLLLKIEWQGFSGKLGKIRIVGRAGSELNLNIKDFCQFLVSFSGGFFQTPCMVYRKELYLKGQHNLETPFGMEVKL